MRKKVNAENEGKERYPLQVRPTPDVRKRLRQAAEASGRSLTKEMEMRLAASVQGDDAPGELYAGTSALLATIGAAADLAGEYFGPWRENAFSHEVLRLVIGHLLDRARPAGEPIAKLQPDSLSDMIFGEKPSPAAAAKTVLGMALTAHKR